MSIVEFLDYVSRGKKTVLIAGSALAWAEALGLRRGPAERAPLIPL